MKHIFTLCLALASGLCAFGVTTYTSTGTGNWTSAGTWSSSGSGSPVRYIIQTGHTVALNGTISNVDSLKVFGTLSFNSGNILYMTNNGMIQVLNGGKITGGSAGSFIYFWLGSISNIIFGPWNGSNTVNGPVFATKNTGSFVTLAPLPVKLVNFTAVSEKNEGIGLEWQTSSEENSQSFEIQRSIDGISWTVIGSVKAKGNSQALSEYHFTDSKPIAGRNYYRFRQIDLNSNFSYSPVVSARLNDATVLQVNTYPNPAGNFVQVSLNMSDLTETPVLQVHDMSGRVLEVPVSKVSDGFIIETGSLSNGYYALSIKAGSESFVQRIAVSH